MSEVEVSGDVILIYTKALASKTRLDIIRLLLKKDADISSLAEILNKTEANISTQIGILERVDLIKVRYESGVHGVRKICSPVLDTIIIKLNK